MLTFPVSRKNVQLRYKSACTTMMITSATAATYREVTGLFDVAEFSSQFWLIFAMSQDMQDEYMPNKIRI